MGVVCVPRRGLDEKKQYDSSRELIDSITVPYGTDLSLEQSEGEPGLTHRADESRKPACDTKVSVQTDVLMSTVMLVVCGIKDGSYADSIRCSDGARDAHLFDGPSDGSLCDGFLPVPRVSKGKRRGSI